MIPAERTSADGALRVRFVSWAEPNNGRMLWKVDITFRGASINPQVFEGDWPYFNQAVDHWRLEDEAQRFFYLPVEGRSKLIRREDFKVIALPWQPASNMRFEGNRFEHGKLLEIFNDQLVLTDLRTLQSRTLTPAIEGYITDACLLDEKTLRVDSFNVREGVRKEYSRTVALT